MATAEQPKPQPKHQIINRWAENTLDGLHNFYYLQAWLWVLTRFDRFGSDLSELTPEPEPT